MVVFSILSKCGRSKNLLTNLTKTKNALVKSNEVAIRKMSDHRIMTITPSRWQWTKFKDLVHYYIMVGLIPVGAVVFYANVFIGPATLSELPEDYVPKHWEYYQHPITRFLAKYVFPNPQQEYEKNMHVMFEDWERAEIRKLEKKVNEKMYERMDFKSYYYRPAIAKYHRVSKEAADYLESLRGD